MRHEDRQEMEKEIRREGRRAFYRGLKVGKAPGNPYPKGSIAFTRWSHGFADAQYEYADAESESV